MDRKLPCDKHEEQIKTLFKRVDGVENKIDDMTEIISKRPNINFDED